MNDYLFHLKYLFKRLLLILVLFSLCRIFFFFLNFSHFSNESILHLFLAFFWGIRFDAATIIYFNIIFILASIVPGAFKNSGKYQRFLFVVYTVVNTVLLFVETGDAKYFDFTDKRSTFDVFSIIGVKSDFLALVPQFAKDYWYVLLFWILLVVVMVKFYPRHQTKQKYNFWGTNYFFQSISFLLFLLVFGTVARGFGLKPLTTNDATYFTSIENVPLVINSSFSILKTSDKPQLSLQNYFPEEKCKTIYSAVRQYKKEGEMQKKNVVIFILESFSKEYSAKLSGAEGYMPFLDSLMQAGLVCTDAYANGKRSNEAMPSIIAGIPSLMDNPYASSQFGLNQINTLANILNKEGYTSAFFHGGTNGTMGFDNFSRVAGFTQYIGRTEYNNEKDFDGFWGIGDEAFLQFFAKKMNSFSKPMFCSVFTLSSHHPYKVPEKYKDKFPKGTLDIHQSIGYTDYCLRKFFKVAAKTDWYKNTLFVFTADHAAQATNKFYETRAGLYQIPILYYCPQDTTLKGEYHATTQQIDIMPSILDYLHYTKPFIAFGSSIFDTEAKRFAVNYMNETYQFIYKQQSLIFNGKESLEMHKIDSLKNISNYKINTLEKNKTEAKEGETLLKAIIQDYNHRLITNKLRN